MPLDVRPARPRLWIAYAYEIGSVLIEVRRFSGLYIASRVKPVSITTVTPSIVTLDSANLLLIMILVRYCPNRVLEFDCFYSSYII